MAAPVIEALSAFHLSQSGWSGYGKEADTLRVPASTMKVMTLYTARKFITDAMLGDTVTVTEADMMAGSTAQLQVGDVVSWNDLFHGLILPSGNDAANCIARVIGETYVTTGGATPSQRFRVKMRQVADDDFGWVGAVFGSPSGNEGNSRLTARMLCELILALDPYSVTVSGALAHTMTITGPNARTYQVLHTIDPDGAVKFPEFVAGKTGTFNGASVVMLWDRGGQRQATAIVGAPNVGNQRFDELRSVMDYVLSLTPPSTGVLEATSWGPFRIDGAEHPVTAVDLSLGGRLMPVWWL